MDVIHLIMESHFSAAPITNLMKPEDLPAA